MGPYCDEPILPLWGVKNDTGKAQLPKKSPVTCHLSHVTCHMSHVTCHMSCVTCHMSQLLVIWACGVSKMSLERHNYHGGHLSHLTCHMSSVTCHMSHVTCHMSYVTCHNFW